MNFEPSFTAYNIKLTPWPFTHSYITQGILFNSSHLLFRQTIFYTYILKFYVRGACALPCFSNIKNNSSSKFLIVTKTVYN